MDKKDFADVLNSMKDLTLIQSIRLIKALKYKTIIAVVLFFASLVGSSFVAGRYSQQQDTAVMLEKPFSMRIQYQNHSQDFDKLVLIKDPAAISTKDNQIVLSLREIHNAFDISQVGKIIATMEDNKLSGIWKVILSSSSNIAHAKELIFNWNGHNNDYNFKEKFINDYTVYRYYSDGCVLSYNVDNNRRSIPSSFKWIERTH